MCEKFRPNKQTDVSLLVSRVCLLWVFSSYDPTHRCLTLSKRGLTTRRVFCLFSKAKAKWANTQSRSKTLSIPTQSHTQTNSCGELTQDPTVTKNLWRKLCNSVCLQFFTFKNCVLNLRTKLTEQLGWSIFTCGEERDKDLENLVHLLINVIWSTCRWGSVRVTV